MITTLKLTVAIISCLVHYFLTQMMHEFECHYGTQTQSSQKHHESSPSFQRDFFTDVQKVYKSFRVNPFEFMELTTVINTEVVFDDNIHYNIKQLEVVGSAQLNVFITERLLMSKVPISEKITLNHFALPGDDKVKKPRGTKVDKRLTSDFFTKLRGALVYRRKEVKNLFATEIFGTAQSLSVSDTAAYHGSKSTLLQRFAECPEPAITPSSALIVEMSPLMRNSYDASTFAEFAKKVLDHILRLATEYKRIDIVFDRYFKDSMKNQTREDRGSGDTISFDRDTKFPSDFKTNFLKNSDNKNRLNVFLASEFFSQYSGDKIIVITKDETVLSNDQDLVVDTALSPNSAEEADQKLVRHTLQCAQAGIGTVVVRTVDTDVILLLLSNVHRLKNKCNVFAWLAAGKKKHSTI